MKRWFVLPRPDLKTVGKDTVFAMAQTGLLKEVFIGRNYSGGQVDTAFRNAFPIINFDAHRYE